MTPLVIDTDLILHAFHDVAYMFDFYPQGFPGLVIEMVIGHLEEPNAGALADHAVVDHVLNLYHASPQYHVYLNDPEGATREQLMHVLVYTLYSSLWQLIRYHREDLAGYSFQPDAIELGTDFEYLMFRRS